MRAESLFSLKILLTILLTVGFSFLIIEQRLQSKEYDARLLTLQRSMEMMNQDKRDITLKINHQLERLSASRVNGLGKPLSLNDVLYVPVLESAKPAPARQPEDLHPFDRLANLLSIR